MLMGMITICAMVGAATPVHAAIFAISTSLVFFCGYNRSSAYSHRLLFIKMSVTLGCFTVVRPSFCAK